MKCEYCGTEMDAASDFAIGKMIESSRGWDDWESWADGHRELVQNVPGVGRVVRLFKFVRDGERYFGGDAEAVMVFSVEGKMYKKVGTTNSYGTTEWDKAFVRVQQVEVTGVEYDRQ